MEGSSKYWMTINNLLNALLECRDIKASAKTIHEYVTINLIADTKLAVIDNPSLQGGHRVSGFSILRKLEPVVAGDEIKVFFFRLRIRNFSTLESRRLLSYRLIAEEIFERNMSPSCRASC